MRATYGDLQLGAVNSTRFTWGRTLTLNRAGVGVGFQWNCNFSEILFRCNSQAECAYLSGLVTAGTAVQGNDLAVYNDDGTFTDHVAFSGGSPRSGSSSPAGAPSDSPPSAPWRRRPTASTTWPATTSTSRRGRATPT